MPPSSRKEKQPIHITYDSDLEKKTISNTSQRQHLGIAEMLVTRCKQGCKNKESINPGLQINNTQMSRVNPTGQCAGFIWSISSGSLARAPWSRASQPCPCLLLSARMFDVISSDVKWLPPGASLQWAFLFFISAEVGPKRTLGWELITSRHPGRDLYSRAQ